jgi:hypothetical protein
MGIDLFDHRPTHSAPAGRAGVAASTTSETERPWLGVRFVCAGAYQRVYRGGDGAGYLACCPRCGRTVRFAVGPGGTDQRFFDLTCRS